MLLIGVALAITLGPFLIFEAEFDAWLSGALDRARTHPLLLAGLVFVLLAGDCVLPVPSSLVSAFSGAALGWTLGAIVVWLGMCCGCLTAYLLGASGGRLFALRILGEAELARAAKLSSQVGPEALIITRAVPVLAETGAIAAGMVRMPFGAFFVSTSLANAVIAVAFALAGVSGQSFFAVFFGLAALPALGWTLWRFFAARRRRLPD